MAGGAGMVASLQRGSSPPSNLPSWFDSFRDGQAEAVSVILKSFQTTDVVILDAPTGAGKTLIAESVRQSLAFGDPEHKTLYVCTTKSLQDQFTSPSQGFPYARLIKGRANYPTANYPQKFPMIACDACTMHGKPPQCQWCDPVIECPYIHAKGEALRAPLAVANTAYLLAEANSPGGRMGATVARGGKMRRRSLIITDEADTLESQLMNYVEVHVSKRRLSYLGIAPPDRKTVPESWDRWVKNEALPAVGDKIKDLGDSKLPDVIRIRHGLNRLADQLAEVELTDGNWVYTGYIDGDVRFRPVRVHHVAQPYFFRHGHKHLLMSATVISPEELAESLGITNYAYYPMPSTFPADRRPIIVRSDADMSHRAQTAEGNTERADLTQALRDIMSAHSRDRILVHTVSYSLTQHLVRALRSSRVLTYTSSHDRQETLNEFRNTERAVLLAPSLDRGIDLPDDACRVIVICKVPFPDLSDRQVSARLHQKGGELWYAVQTIRSLVQMSGRAMRHEGDWAITYILDRQFVNNLWRKNRRLMPRWFTAALQWHTRIGGPPDA